MKELYTMVVFILISIFFLFGVGKIFYDERTAPNANIEAFFKSLENPKVVNYYLDQSIFGNRTILIKVDKSSETVEACYSVSGSYVKRIYTDCKADISIIMDEHSMGSLIYANYNPKSTLISEYLLGHIKIEGLNLNDIRGFI